MIRIMLIILLLVALAQPAPSHAFGILRWAWDGLSNQLGLDRGPVPKVIPRICHPAYDPRSNRDPLNARIPPFYIQAEGF